MKKWLGWFTPRIGETVAKGIERIVSLSHFEASDADADQRGPKCQHSPMQKLLFHHGNTFSADTFDDDRPAVDLNLPACRNRRKSSAIRLSDVSRRFSPKHAIGSGRRRRRRRRRLEYSAMRTSGVCVPQFQL